MIGRQLFSAAYRNHYDEICTVGTPDPSLDRIACVVRSANQDDPDTRFFIAETVQVWRQWHAIRNKRAKLTCPSCLYTELVSFNDYHLCPHCGWSTRAREFTAHSPGLFRQAADCIADWINGAPCTDPTLARSLINRLDEAAAVLDFGAGA